MNVIISLSEPWELGERLGWRPLAGQVVTTVLDDAGGQVLIRLQEPLLLGNSSWHYVIASPRHEGSTIAALEEPEGLIGAIIGVPDDKAESRQPFTAGRRPSTAYFIGTVRAII